MMRLTIDILLDELADFHPIVHKAVSATTTFEQIYCCNAQDSLTNSSFLYLADATSLAMDFSEYCPKHLLILGRKVSHSLFEHADTLIQIPDQVCLEELYQFIMNIFVSYNNWNQSMLLAIIHHKSISEFLEIAAQKLTNPIALFDNNLTVITKTGQFTQPIKGTIWEKIEDLLYVPPEFFTLKEQGELSKMVSNSMPYTYHPAIDQEHTYVTSHIWINDKLCGNVGLIDINSPFSGGQLSIIHHITETLKLYFQNNEVYMRIAENDTFFIKQLLESTSIDEKIITYYLKKLKWKRHDEFYLLNFACPIPLNSPIESIAYIKRINQRFPKSLITIYNKSIILILRNRDYPIKNNTEEKHNLEQFLTNSEMKCGVSACFTDFLQLKYYYTQSSFAVEYCSQHTDTILQHYEDCHKEHIVQLLQNTIDLKCLCHPQILSLWNTQEEDFRELIRCLYHFLINGRSLAMTAKTLYLHRNTLIYRLNKISQILNMDLKNLSSKELFYLLFSCMLVEYL